MPLPEPVGGGTDALKMPPSPPPPADPLGGATSVAKPIAVDPLPLVAAADPIALPADRVPPAAEPPPAALAAPVAANDVPPLAIPPAIAAAPRAAPAPIPRTSLPDNDSAPLSTDAAKRGTNMQTATYRQRSCKHGPECS